MPQVSLRKKYRITWKKGEKELRPDYNQPYKKGSVTTLNTKFWEAAQFDTKEELEAFVKKEKFKIK